MELFEGKQEVQKTSVNKMKIGIVGLGTIGSELKKTIDKIPKAELIGIYDIDDDKRTTDLDSLINQADLIIETAHPDIVKQVLEKCIEKKKDILSLSIGGVLAFPNIFERIKQAGINLYLPSGAVAGIDAIKAVNGEATSITLTTTKPAKTLNQNITEKQLIFQGNAIKAVKEFPTSINVAAILSLASIGPENVNVKIFADPNITNNQHEICMEGPFGKITTKVENLPSENNPKTSYLAIASAKKTLKQIFEKVKIGT
jgi:aspartate dehydrogenase